MIVLSLALAIFAYPHPRELPWDDYLVTRVRWTDDRGYEGRPFVYFVEESQADGSWRQLTCRDSRYSHPTPASLYCDFIGLPSGPHTLRVRRLRYGRGPDDISAPIAFSLPAPPAGPQALALLP